MSKRSINAVDQLPQMGRALIEGLQALRGVAKTTAVGAFAEVGRFSRFDNARQLMAYTGLNMPELFEFA